jgi:hypothetical protein
MEMALPLSMPRKISLPFRDVPYISYSSGLKSLLLIAGVGCATGGCRGFTSMSMPPTMPDVAVLSAGLNHGRVGNASMDQLAPITQLQLQHDASRLRANGSLRQVQEPLGAHFLRDRHPCAPCPCYEGGCCPPPHSILL